MDVCGRIGDAFHGITDAACCSPQFIAEMVSKTKKIKYLDVFYPALRAYKNVFEYAEKNDIQYLITIGCVDIADLPHYSAIIGLKNDDINDYTKFPQEMNTTQIEITNLNCADILFDTIDEVLHFIRIVINNDRKEKKEKIDE